MKTQHTPGPWFVPTPTYRTLYVEARIGNRMLQEVASCGPTADPAQQAANAQLIAAAPALLEALEKCRKELSAWMRCYCEDTATQEAISQASAAIAKATGEQA